MATLKQVGDSMRARLKTAQANGVIPGHGTYRPEYKVRVSNTRKSGPAVNITIEDYGQLIGDVENDAVREAWHAAAGQALIAKVDQIIGRDKYQPALGGVTRFGMLMISATATDMSYITIGGTVNP